MKAETQADRLERLMHSRQLHPVYRLTLPPFEVKKSALGKLKAGQLFLVGLDQLELVLLDENGSGGKVLFEDATRGRIKITELNDTLLHESSKKHQRILVVLAEVQSRKMEVGHIIETTGMRFEQLPIVADGKTVAQGSLVKVDKEIAVQIDKVEK